MPMELQLKVGSSPPPEKKANRDDSGKGETTITGEELCDLQLMDESDSPPDSPANKDECGGDPAARTDLAGEDKND